MNQNPVTEFDLRAPEYKHSDTKPEDFERREDGAVVRKDRWRNGIFSIASYVGVSVRNFEVNDVVDAAERASQAESALKELYVKLCAEQIRLQSIEMQAIPADDPTAANVRLVTTGRREGITAAIRLLTDICGDNRYVLL